MPRPPRGADVPVDPKTLVLRDHTIHLHRYFLHSLFKLQVEGGITDSCLPHTLRDHDDTNGRPFY